MAEFEIFREQLAIKYPAFGYALWEPRPPDPDRPVEVGDVGFIRKGRFHSLFNALRPAEGQPNVPDGHEKLVPKFSNHITESPLSSNHYCSAGITVEPESEYHAFGPDDFRQVSFKHSRRRGGAVLYLPVMAQRKDTLAQGDFGAWIVKHIDRWFAFARGLGLGIEKMEEIILVTGCDHTRSWTNVAFLGDEHDAQATFGVRVIHDPAISIEWQGLPEHVQGGVLHLGPDGMNLPGDQCVFIRGFRVARTFGILPKHLKAAAGPSSDTGGYGYEPDTEVVSIPAAPKNRDPLHMLLDYIVERAPDCDMFLIHDDDLKSIDGIGDGASLEALQLHLVMDILRWSNIEIHTDQFDLSHVSSNPNSNTKVVRVAMFSEHPNRPCTSQDHPNQPNTSQEHLNRPYTSHDYPNQSYTSLRYPIPFVRSEGFLTMMFGRRDAAFFIESLLKMNVRDVVLYGNVPGWHNALMVPKPFINDRRCDAFASNNQPLWLLDIIPLPMYRVVPQKIWTPPSQSDWRRYVEQASLCMPVFFIQNDGAIGLPLARALSGQRALLRCGDTPAPLGGGHSTQIRIAWPGYGSWERQIQIRDHTRERNEITLERFAKLVAGVVDRFITVAAATPAPDNAWSVGTGGITSNNLIIVGAVQVSAGGWMPILQVLNPTPPTPTSHYYPVHA